MLSQICKVTQLLGPLFTVKAISNREANKHL